MGAIPSALTVGVLACLCAGAAVRFGSTVDKKLTLRGMASQGKTQAVFLVDLHWRWSGDGCGAFVFRDAAAFLKFIFFSHTQADFGIGVHLGDFRIQFLHPLSSFG